MKKKFEDDILDILRDPIEEETDTEYDSIPLLASDYILDDKDSANYAPLIPILPLRNTVLFPGIVIPLTIGRRKSRRLIDAVKDSIKYFGAVTQRRADVDRPGFADLYSVGTVAEIIRIIDMPDDSISVIIQGMNRFHLDKIAKLEPFLQGNVTYIDATPESSPKNANAVTDVVKASKNYTALLDSLKDIALKVVKADPAMSPQLSFAIKNIDNPVFMVNFIASNIDIEAADKQKLLEITDLYGRSETLMQILLQRLQFLQLKSDIQSKVKRDIDKQQKEFMLQQQMKTIQEELGDNPVTKEVNDMQEAAAHKKWSAEVKEHFDKELDKLNSMHPSSPEYTVQLNYLQTLLDLPWNVYTRDNFNLKRAKKILDADHYGLDKVKDRILEHLAVLKLKKDMKSPILCLYGPPGVGKTSLGKSIAAALGRKYVRMSLGGVHDESEIRGHRKTYVGAMPGRIIRNVIKAKASNPVFVLDEIDKVGSDFRGDPASALLEVLDPEQNSEFHDNFLEIEYDLSKILFIATANDITTINPALRDRMELIDVSGYINEEKLEIAKRHLFPKQVDNHGLKDLKLKLTDEAIYKIIGQYTRESGVRGLDKNLAKIVRQIAKKVVLAEPVPEVIGENDIRGFLGTELYDAVADVDEKEPGVVTGLAWTTVGGEILFVETSLSRGKGNLSITGNLGDVMKESATIAYEYVKAHAEFLNIVDSIFEKWNLHVHVPEGAIPKDGPSAGITMATAMASIFTQRRVRGRLAMTGEITLRGKVLPVGGIKEKILAAKRAGISDIILSKDNKKNIDDINEMYVKGLTFHYVTTVGEVFDLALCKEVVEHPKRLVVN